jgi:hypothetical protein
LKVLTVLGHPDAQTKRFLAFVQGEKDNAPDEVVFLIDHTNVAGRPYSILSFALRDPEVRVRPTKADVGKVLMYLTAD